MKKRNKIVYYFVPVIIVLALFLVFYERIACKPNHAGFWFVLALGMALGAAITRIFFAEKDKSRN